ncbi:prefoldin subunit alpha [Candidatus Woesearchaeota archaeon]|nr:MAG: prefoldin subunit alpha [Candidatus Woesearchaeota archaeon]
MNEKVRSKYLELQALQHQLSQVQKQIEALGSQAGEMDVVAKALDEFKKVEAGSELFVTLTPGVFVRARIEDTGSVLLNVGGGAVVKKSVEDGKNIIVEQSKELRNLQKELSDQLEKLAERAQSVQGELQELVSDV